MITLHAEASALTVTAGLDDTMLVAGMANVASVQVTFSEDWTGLGKTLLFYNGDKTILHLMESDDEIVPIPHEVLAIPGRTLYVGVQGTDGERVILPTVRCKLKAVLASIDPDGDRETIPDKPHWEQVREDLQELAESAAETAQEIDEAAAAVHQDRTAAETAASAASGSASAAAEDAAAAAASAEAAQEWATGGEGGTASATNNAKYWAGQAAAQAEAAAGSAASGIAALANEAPTFDATAAYTAGEYVLYNSVLYRFKTDHAAGAWTGTDAAIVKITDDVRRTTEPLKVNYTPSFNWANGGISSDNGGNITNSKRIRTNEYIYMLPYWGYQVTVPSGYYVIAYYYGEWAYSSYKHEYRVFTSGTHDMRGLPDGYNYLRLICAKGDNTNITKEEAPEIGLIVYKITDTTLTLSNKAADAKTVGTVLAQKADAAAVETELAAKADAASLPPISATATEAKELAENIDDIISVNASQTLVWENGGISDTTGGYNTRSDRIRDTTYFRMIPDRGLTLSIPSGYFVTVYFYGSAAYTAYKNDRRTLTAGTKTIADLPDDYTYFRVTCGKGNNAPIVYTEAPDIILVVNDVTDKTLTLINKAADAKKVGTELAKKADADVAATKTQVKEAVWNADTESWGLANILARAKQICDIEWTPVGNMPRTNKNTVYPDPIAYFSLTKHKGIPYSSVRDQDKAVGMDVSIRTFMTAVHDPKSVLYTRRSTVSNSATYYGTVCSGLVNYAMGYELNLSNYYLAGSDMFETIPMRSIRVGDMIWVDGHCAMIADMEKDAYGRISKVTVQEEWRALPRYVEYSSWQEFMTDRAGYIARRFKNSADVPYTALPYIQLFDEPSAEIVYPDVQTEFGDAAVFMAGEDVKINVIGTPEFSSITVTRGSTVVYTTDIVEDFTLSNVQPGLHTITAHSDTSDSVSTFFVVDASASFNDVTGEVTFSSANATPEMVGVYHITTISGGKRDVGVKPIILTDADRAAGHINVLDKMSDSYRYAKVWFRTPYGTAVWYSESHDKWVPIT